GVTHHQHRLTKPGSFLLHTSAIGEHQISLLHQKHERFIPQWLNQMHITSTAQQALHRLLNVGIQVNRVDKVHIRVGSCQSAERFTDILEAFAKVLTAVPSYQHISLSQHLCVQPSL